jgi:hypothetical protein
LYLDRFYFTFLHSNQIILNEFYYSAYQKFISKFNVVQLAFNSDNGEREREREKEREKEKEKEREREKERESFFLISGETSFETESLHFTAKSRANRKQKHLDWRKEFKG